MALPVCDHLHLRAEHNYNLRTKHVRWQILQKRKMKDSNESMINNDVQEGGSTSTIPRDILPVMEVKHNNSTNYIHIQLTT